MTSELAALVGKHTRQDGITATSVANLYLYRYSSSSPSDRGIPGPSLCAVVQGGKRTMLGDSSSFQPAGDYMLTPVELPVTGNVVKASTVIPFLGFRYDLDLGRVALFAVDHQLKAPAKRFPANVLRKGIALRHMSPELADGFLRLLKLLDRPAEIPFLEPLLNQEILFRLNQDGHGMVFESIARSSSHVHVIARLVNWMKRNVERPLSGSAIANEAGMSSSVLYSRFHDVTGMSPIQFHKQLRLQEARRILTTSAADITSAAMSVGYRSPSQFSREYARLFGRSPGRDLKEYRK